MNWLHDAIRAAFLLVALAAGFAISGCDDKETLLEVETPDGEVLVEEDTDTGAIDIDVDRE